MSKNTYWLPHSLTLDCVYYNQNMYTIRESVNSLHEDSAVMPIVCEHCLTYKTILINLHVLSLSGYQHILHLRLYIPNDTLQVAKVHPLTYHQEMVVYFLSNSYTSENFLTNFSQNWQNRSS